MLSKLEATVRSVSLGRSTARCPIHQRRNAPSWW